MQPIQSSGFSYLFSVEKLPQNGTKQVLELTVDECLQLAQYLNLAEIKSFKADFNIHGTSDKVTVSGVVDAVVVQTCVVSLELFEAYVHEQIEAEFVAEKKSSKRSEEQDLLDHDDLIINGKINLGSLATEFFVLGLDPFPKKPGAEFHYIEDDSQPSPFDRLRDLEEK